MSFELNQRVGLLGGSWHLGRGGPLYPGTLRLLRTFPLPAHAH